jgi:phosphotransferase system enzyme I (PtsI)
MKTNRTAQEERKEQVTVTCHGIGVSPGVAVGSAFLLSSDEERVVERDIEPGEIEREVSRFEDALIATREQLHEIQQQVGEAIGQESAGIFDAHLMVVDDRALVEEVIKGLSEKGKNVEYVLYHVAEQYAEVLSNVEDDYLRERAADVRDVARRILHNLAGRSRSVLDQVQEPCILIANDLAPSDAATLNRDKIIGLATDLGSPTSHTAIMARALEIPAIVGLRDVSVRVSQGDPILLDGDKGLLMVHPEQETLNQYGRIAEERASIRSELETLKDEPAETIDGYHVLLSANIELPGDVDAVLAHGAKGVGLFRTEYLFLSRDEVPTEEEQFEAYDHVAGRLAPDPVIIRTLDLGGDKFLSNIRMPTEMNPFMGWRAIRFCLAQPEIFKVQLRALLRASVHGNLKIMYPMISNVGEVLRANEMLEEAKQELRDRGYVFDEKLEVGIMVEVPSAALTADLIAPHVSFFSLGTNDLVQYTLAVDRVNERIAHLYEPAHPAIIKLIKQTTEIAHENGIWVGLCGEMAGNPLLVPLLVGLGIDEFSVSPAGVAVVKDAIRSVRYAQAEELAEQALASVTGDGVMQLCRELTAACAPEILELVG